MNAGNEIEPPDLDDWADAIAASALASATGCFLGIDPVTAYDCLCSIPENMLCLLRSSEGWVALSGYIAGAVGRDARDYAPTVH